MADHLKGCVSQRNNGRWLETTQQYCLEGQCRVGAGNAGSLISRYFCNIDKPKGKNFFFNEKLLSKNVLSYFTQSWETERMLAAKDLMYLSVRHGRLQTNKTISSSISI